MQAQVPPEPRRGGTLYPDAEEVWATGPARASVEATIDRGEKHFDLLDVLIATALATANASGMQPEPSPTLIRIRVEVRVRLYLEVDTNSFRHR